MKKYILTCFMIGSVLSIANAQETCEECGIGTDTPDATLEIKGCGTSSSKKTLDVQDGNGKYLLRVYDDGNTYMKKLKILNYGSVLEMRDLQSPGNSSHWRHVVHNNLYRLDYFIDGTGTSSYKSAFKINYDPITKMAQLGINSYPKTGYALTLASESDQGIQTLDESAMISFQNARAYIGYRGKLGNHSLHSLVIGAGSKKNIIFTTGLGSHAYDSKNEAMRITHTQKVGIGERYPTAKFHVNGTIAHNVVILSSTDVLDWDSGSYIVCEDSRTLNLPLSVYANKGFEYVIKATTGSVTLTTSSTSLIDNSATYVIPSFGFVKIVSDGKGKWYIIGKG